MRKTRAALLPYCYDPFLLKEWLACFSIWRDEIDRLYICMNGTTSPAVRDYIDRLLWLASIPEGKIVVLREDTQLDHGPALNRLLEICTEDLVMLVEEDGFVFKKGRVDACFTMTEEGICDIVGSARGSCAKEIYERAEQIWHTPPQAPNFWPNFFFIARENLLKTDRHFHAKAWHKGDYVKELDLTITDDVSPADTFVWASIQLRSMGLKAHLTEQYHSRIEDIQDKDHITGIFDRKAPWVHIGSLSGWQHVLFDPLQPRIGEIEEHERRTGAWLFFWEEAQENLPENMKTFSEQYKKGIHRLIEEYTLSPARVKLRANLYRYLINPESYAKRSAEESKI